MAVPAGSTCFLENSQRPAQRQHTAQRSRDVHKAVEGHQQEKVVSDAEVSPAGCTHDTLIRKLLGVEAHADGAESSLLDTCKRAGCATMW